MGVVQLGESRRIEEANFIVGLNQAFVENEMYARIYLELEKNDLQGLEPNLNRLEISNYLTFFETVYLLVKDGVLKFEVLDNLFAYRFFLAVHNETFQELKLVSSPNNFRNIYYLEKRWMDYRKKRGLTIYKEENCLKNACIKAGKEKEYLEIIG